MRDKYQLNSAVTVLAALVINLLSGVMPVLGQPQGEQHPKSEISAEWKSIEGALGRSGKLQGSVLKFGMPRSDLQVTVGELSIRPTLALGAWVAFDSPGKNALMMGDLVLTESEVGPVMASLRQHNIEITALHNHVFLESPRVLYMHIAAHGEASAIAGSVRTALLLTGTPPPAAGTQGQVDLDVAGIERVMNYKGSVNGGVLQMSVPRAEAINEHGRGIPASMGISTAMNFQPAGNGRAAVTGDFVLLAEEVNPVIDSLTRNRIAVTALHSHMLEESPRLFFLHFWAVDDAMHLARALRAALDRTNSARAPTQ